MENQSLFTTGHSWIILLHFLWTRTDRPWFYGLLADFPSGWQNLEFNAMNCLVTLINCSNSRCYSPRKSLISWLCNAMFPIQDNAPRLVVRMVQDFDQLLTEMKLIAGWQAMIEEYTCDTDDCTILVPALLAICIYVHVHVHIDHSIGLDKG